MILYIIIVKKICRNHLKSLSVPSIHFEKYFKKYPFSFVAMPLAIVPVILVIVNLSLLPKIIFYLHNLLFLS